MRLSVAITGALALLALGGTANAADVYSSGSTKDSPTLFGGSSGSWTGFYVGINGGYGWDAKENFSDAIAYSGTLIGDLQTGVQPTGWFGGLTAGANYQTGGVVVGVTTDLDLASITDSGAVTVTSPLLPGPLVPNTIPGAATQSRIDWLGTFQGRVGLPFGNFMPFVSAGAAYGGVSTRSVVSTGAGFVPINLSQDDTRFGWVAGAGVEYKVSPGWSVFGKYEYVDLGSASLSGASLTSAAASMGATVSPNKPDNTLSLIKLGIVYKIGADLVHPIN